MHLQPVQSANELPEPPQVISAMNKQQMGIKVITHKPAHPERSVTACPLGWVDKSPSAVGYDKPGKE